MTRKIKKRTSIEELSIYTERVWLRISKNNKEKLVRLAEKNRRNLWPQVDQILEEYFKK
jgi:hypothetical protein